MRKGNALVFFLLGLLFVSISAAGFFFWKSEQMKTPLTYDECVKMPGSRSTLMLPSTCYAWDGREATQTLTEADKKKVQSPDETVNWKTYSNALLGFEFKYPEKLIISEQNGVVTLIHAIPFKNNGDCDMKGGSETFDNLTDFKVSFEISRSVPLIKTGDGKYQKGILNGTYSYQGVEGCGETSYYFPSSGKQTLLVKKASIQILSDVIAPQRRNEVLKVPGVISREENNLLFDQILSTFKFAN